MVRPLGACVSNFFHTQPFSFELRYRRATASIAHLCFEIMTPTRYCHLFFLVVAELAVVAVLAAVAVLAVVAEVSVVAVFAKAMVYANVKARKVAFNVPTMNFAATKLQLKAIDNHCADHAAEDDSFLP